MKKKLKYVLYVLMGLLLVQTFALNDSLGRIVLPPPPTTEPLEVGSMVGPTTIWNWETPTLEWYVTSGYTPNGYIIRDYRDYLSLNQIVYKIGSGSWQIGGKISYTFHPIYIGSHLIEIAVSDQSPNTVKKTSWIQVNQDADSDGDGLWDHQEEQIGSKVDKVDTDDDLLTDYEEYYTYHTNLCNPDSDDDGLIDGWEIYFYDTDPLDKDSDDDDHSDYIEVLREMDPNDNSDGGDRFALIVAIDDYESVQDLSSPVYHANWWHDLLVSEQGYNPSHISMLLNRDATESNIEDALEEIGSKSGKKISIIFLGHGQIDVFGNFFYGGCDCDDTWGYTHKVTSEEIYASIKNADVDEIYLNIGSCYSGELIHDLQGKPWDQKVLIHTAEKDNDEAEGYISGIGYRQMFEYRFLELTFDDHFSNSPAVDLSQVFNYMKTFWPTDSPWNEDEPQTWDNLGSTEIIYL